MLRGAQAGGSTILQWLEPCHALALLDQSRALGRVFDHQWRSRRRLLQPNAHCGRSSMIVWRPSDRSNADVYRFLAAPE